MTVYLKKILKSNPIYKPQNKQTNNNNTTHTESMPMGLPGTGDKTQRGSCFHSHFIASWTYYNESRPPPAPAPMNSNTSWSSVSLCLECLSSSPSVNSYSPFSTQDPEGPGSTDYSLLSASPDSSFLY